MRRAVKSSPCSKSLVAKVSIYMLYISYRSVLLHLQVRAFHRGQKMEFTASPPLLRCLYQPQEEPDQAKLPQALPSVTQVVQLHFTCFHLSRLRFHQMFKVPILCYNSHLAFFVGEQPSFMIQKDLQTAEYRAPFKSDALLQNKKLSKNEV